MRLNAGKTAHPMSISTFLSKIKSGGETGKPTDSPARVTREALKAFRANAAEDLHLVYSPMKVGGKSLVATLRELNPPGKIAHVHFLSDWGLEFLESIIERHGPDKAWKKQFEMAAALRGLLGAREQLARTAPRTQLKMRKPVVITAVREPLSLHFSAMFQVWFLYAAREEELEADFLSRSFEEIAWHRWTHRWFTEELKTMFDIDVLAEPFPVEQGWQIRENDRARLLLIRTENLGSVTEALAALYQIPPSSIAVRTRNTAGEKTYADHYAKVREAIRLSPAVVRTALELPYARHFYTETELAAAAKKWRTD